MLFAHTVKKLNCETDKLHSWQNVCAGKRHIFFNPTQRLMTRWFPVVLRPQIILEFLLRLDYNSNKALSSSRAPHSPCIILVCGNSVKCKFQWECPLFRHSISSDVGGLLHSPALLTSVASLLCRALGPPASQFGWGTGAFLCSIRLSWSYLKFYAKLK